MKDNIFNFYIFGVITNLVLVLSYIKLTTRRYSGHFREIYVRFLYELISMAI